MTQSNTRTTLLDAEDQVPSTGVKDVALVAVQSQQAFADVVERLAANPAVDVVKLEKIIELQERIIRHNAESAFNVAFAAMQADIPTIIERASTDKTSYAPIEDIIEPIRPVLKRHGFSLSFKTEWPEKGTVKVIGILTHAEGHARTSEFQSAADQTGSKNAIQAFGSSVSYGRRYTAKDLLCIVTREEDDDGEASEKAKQPEAPEGYDPWFSTLDGVASEGMATFAKAWNNSPEAFRRHLSATAPTVLARLKTKAAKVKP